MLAISAGAGQPQKVFTNVSTDDVNKAAMAVKFTHGLMKSKGMPATLFFNVYAVRLVNRYVPSPVYPTGQSLQQMLDAFMKDGGTVLACPMCMKNVGGMTTADLYPGVNAMEGGGANAASQPDTMILSY
jgi:predicted peroxiredoxin